MIKEGHFRRDKELEELLPQPAARNSIKRVATKRMANGISQSNIGFHLSPPVHIFNHTPHHLFSIPLAQFLKPQGPGMIRISQIPQLQHHPDGSRIVSQHK
jgi:hypothetical protein